MDRAGFDEVSRFFFRAQGRISRHEYRLGILFILALGAAGLSVALGGAAVPPFVVLLLSLSGLPLAIGQFVLVAKRCHDFGLPGAFSVLLLVPIFGLFWLFALMLVPGSPGLNRYGPPVAFRSD